jgi:5-methylcytosine-specific restriction enzyme A
MILRACGTCGTPSPGLFSAEHKPKPWATSKRRQRMGIGGGAWATVRRKVLERDLGYCYLCDRPGAREVDHLVEVSEGGTNDLTNLASCHAACHKRRHAEPEGARERAEIALRVIAP